MSNAFYSNGKLLITGEYFVLEGALAFALPLNLGQQLIVEQIDDSDGQLLWETFVKDKLWFTANYSLEDIKIRETSEINSAKYIQMLLHQIKRSTSALNDINFSLKMRSKLEFPTEWGLGSSSSLISNLAYWAKTDPYQLLFNTFDGSGYDIACARAVHPLLYQLQKEPAVSYTKFNSNFLDYIYFIYLGQKKDSLQAVKKYRDRIKKSRKDAKQISRLTRFIVQSNSLDEFNFYLDEHEQIISKVIKEPRIGTRYFHDFNGTTKSLGTWGGDFFMATSKEGDHYVKRYFASKGMHILFPYKELVL